MADTQPDAISSAEDEAAEASVSAVVNADSSATHGAAEVQHTGCAKPDERADEENEDEEDDEDDEEDDEDEEEEDEEDDEENEAGGDREAWSDEESSDEEEEVYDLPPLHHGAATADVEWMSQLLAGTAEGQAELGEEGIIGVDDVDVRSRTALHIATLYNEVASVDFLLDSGASAALYDDDDYNPLELAVLQGHRDIVERMLQEQRVLDMIKAPQRNADGSLVDENAVEDVTSSIHLAASSAEHEILSLLIEAGADVMARDEQGALALHHACNSDSVVCLDLLLSASAQTDLGAALNAQDGDGCSALHWAADKGYANACRILLQFGALVDAVDDGKRTPLHWAARDGHIDVIQVLIEFKASVNAVDEQGITPLSYAAENGCTAAVALILAVEGVNADLGNTQEVTPLMYASYNEHVECTAAIARASKAINAVDAVGRSAAHWAAAGQSEACVRVLIQHEIDATLRDAEQLQAIHFAVMKGNPALVDLLMDAAPSTVIACDSGVTSPLHVAVGYGWLNCCQQMLDAGMDVNIADEEGFTPLDWAIQYEQRELINYLKNNDAQTSRQLDPEGFEQRKKAREEQLRLHVEQELAAAAQAAREAQAAKEAALQRAAAAEESAAAAEATAAAAVAQAAASASAAVLPNIVVEETELQEFEAKQAVSLEMQRRASNAMTALEAGFAPNKFKRSFEMPEKASEREAAEGDDGDDDDEDGTGAGDGGARSSRPGAKRASARRGKPATGRKGKKAAGKKTGTKKVSSAATAKLTKGKKKPVAKLKKVGKKGSSSKKRGKKAGDRKKSKKKDGKKLKGKKGGKSAGGGKKGGKSSGRKKTGKTGKAAKGKGHARKTSTASAMSKARKTRAA